jgi:RimJ/RimL family protein N-acetyltransferase
MIESDIADFHAAFAAQGWDKPIALLAVYYQGQQEGKHQIFVAMVGDEVAGYTVLLPQIRGGTYPIGTPEISDFGVLEKHQRQGVGNAMMDAAEKAASEFSDIVALSVGLHSGYGAAQRIYAKRGYIPDGSGAWYKGKLHPQYAPCVLDDDLLIYMSRRLERHTPQDVIEVKTTRLTLRRFTTDDCRDLHEYLSQEETVKFEPYGVYTEEMARAEAIRRADDSAFWACVLTSSGKLIGNVYLAEQDCGNWELGYVFNKNYWHHGYASEAVKAMMNWAFTEKNANRITAMCNPLNIASWELLERIGMRREGHLKSNVFFNKDADGNPIWQDTLEYAALKEDCRGEGWIFPTTYCEKN